MTVLESLNQVIEGSTYVHISEKGVQEFVTQFNQTKIDHWLTVSPFDLGQLSEKERVAFLFVLNSISFSYWGTPKWKVRYSGHEYDGAQAMIACLGKAVEEKKEIFEPQYISQISRNELEHILKGTVEIPLFNHRLRFLRELGMVTEEKFKGDFRYVIDRSGDNALSFVEILTDNFISFRDTAEYQGHTIEFSKRAQLLSADLSHFFGMADSDKLTACADYKLPQVLRRYDVLHYDPPLSQKIKEKRIIPAGSQEEVEIRAQTIHAVELIKKEIGLTANQVNDYLWLEGQTKLPTDELYHRTRTTAY